MKGDTKCADCGSAYPPYEQHTRKQWSDDTITSITTKLKDVFKELFPSLPEAAQEKLKTSFPRLVQTLEAPKSTFLALQQKLFLFVKKIEKQGHVAAQSRIKADTEFEKLLELKQEYQKLKQEVVAPDITDNSTAEPTVLPQPDAVADEPTKSELTTFLAKSGLPAGA